MSYRKKREKRMARRIPEDVRNKLVIKVVETRTQNMIHKCLEMTSYDAQYRIPWIVFDRDRVVDFDEIVSEAERAGIHVGWSNPCFEIWMYTYLGSMPAILESWICCKRFGDRYKKCTGQDYSKADTELYRRITQNGDEGKALSIAQRKYEQCIRNGYDLPSQMCPCTTVHILVGEIRNKTEETKKS